MKDLFIVPDHLKLPQSDFQDIVEDQIQHIRKTLANKQQEYAPGDDDAMHNFNVAMAIEQVQTNVTKTREDTIWDMAKKHYVSIMDMRVDLMLGRPTNKITVPYINEKFGDMINYFILLKASFMQTLKLPIPVSMAGSNANTMRSETVPSMGRRIELRGPNGMTVGLFWGDIRTPEENGLVVHVEKGGLKQQSLKSLLQEYPGVHYRIEG